jgi:hypothetical protein
MPDYATLPNDDQSGVPHGSISRAQIVSRAQRWLSEKVPYSQTSWWSDADGTYRQDCSGYVSMAWALPQTIDFWTGNLNTVSHRIPAAQLEPGDILLSMPHTVIFAGWADQRHDAFNLYEEAMPGTNARYVVDAPLSDYLDNGFAPFRYDGVSDSNATLPSAPRKGLRFSLLGRHELEPAGPARKPVLPRRTEPMAAPVQAPADRQPTVMSAAPSSDDQPLTLAAGTVLAAAAAAGLVGSTLLGARSMRNRAKPKD